MKLRNDNLAQAWIMLVGIVLLAVGLLGFSNNPLVGGANALFPTGNVHNVVHVLTGLVALYIAFIAKGADQINGVIGFGILYVVIFVACLVSPNLFGLFDINVNVADHLLHAGVAVVSLGLGYVARTAAMSKGMTR